MRRVRVSLDSFAVQIVDASSAVTNLRGALKA